MNVRRAICALNAAGLTVAGIAAAVGVHRSTVYRWRAGTRQPSAASLATLRRAVDQWNALRHQMWPRQRPHLERARHWLTTEEERAELARLAEAIRENLRRAAEPRRVPVTTLAPAFAVVRDRDDLDAQLDALFDLAA